MEVLYERSAERDLARLPAADARVVVDAFAAYAARGLGDIKKLRDFKVPTWRLRVGRYRVLYRREGRVLIVVAVSNRKDAYR
ncbi:MAG TPA: type II toxin-antitoxin system RelE/ParE family toxin [Candidatus Baltobacteraceae bacterium]|nr:type II toxin-antitoxin system RelE/ParE family toxin [Candidatus Baltobacteraceae bacterium]